MSTKPTSAASGAIGAGVGTVGRLIQPQSQNIYNQGQSLYNTGTNELAAYAKELSDFLSPDASTRMEANVANIDDATALAVGEKRDIANQPRSGAQAYEFGQVDQSTAKAIGDALSASFNTAVQAEGQLGEFTTTSGMTGEQAGVAGQEAAAGLDINAGNAYTGLAPVVNAQNAATEADIAGIAGMFAAL